jgi:hypothetical protein
VVHPQVEFLVAHANQQLGGTQERDLDIFQATLQFPIDLQSLLQCQLLGGFGFLSGPFLFCHGFLLFSVNRLPQSSIGRYTTHVDDR